MQHWSANSLTADQPGAAEATGHAAPGGLFLGPPAYVASTPWPPWRAVLATLAIVGAGGVAAVASVHPMLDVSAVGNGAAPEMLALAAWQVVVIGLVLMASALFGGRISEVLALRRPRGGVGAYVGALLLLVGLNAVVSGVQYAASPQDLFVDLRPFVSFMTGPNWLFALLVIGIGAPLAEELLFRGFLLSALANTRLGFMGAATVTTAIWTVLHAGYSIIGIVEVFVIGMFFCWLLWRTGSLRVTIFCHALYNSIIVVLLRYVPLPA